MLVGCVGPAGATIIIGSRLGAAVKHDYEWGSCAKALRDIDSGLKTAGVRAKVPERLQSMGVVDALGTARTRASVKAHSGAVKVGYVTLLNSVLPD